MDVHAIHEATQEVVKKKFGRKKYLTSRVVTHYPQNVEREYVRVANAYMKLFNKTLAEHMPRMRDILSKDDSYKLDAADNELTEEELSEPTIEPPMLESDVDSILNEIMEDFIKQQGIFELHKRLEKISNLNRKMTVNEWKRAVKHTLGIDIMDDYYMGEKFQYLLDKWVSDNVALIKSIPQETLGNMRKIIKKSYLSGTPNKDIAKQIQDAYGVSKSRAQFIARDQIAKLNSDITTQQQLDAGITEYVWRTVGDGRVRNSHRHLNNKRFKYSDPPVVDKKTGRRASPGKDFRCRCVALPVFDIDTVVLPWEKAAKEHQR